MALPLDTFGYMCVFHPSLQNEITSRIKQLIEIAEDNLNKNIFKGNKFYQASAYLVLHWIALTDSASGRGTTPGSVISKKEGQLQLQYGAVSTSLDKQYLSQTTWGLALLDLMNTCIIGPMNRCVSFGS